MALRLRVPHTLVLIGLLIVFAWAAGFVVPPGRFDRVTGPDGHEVVQPGSFHWLDRSTDPTPWSLLTAVPRGFAQSQDIIFFVFLIGGTIAIVRHTGAIDAGLAAALRRIGGRRSLLIGAGISLFAIGSSTLGMAEEYLPFVVVLVALGAGLRMDPLSSIAIMIVGYGVGYAAATINPFTVVVAQQISGLPPTSGLWFRLLLFVPLVAIGFHHVWKHAQQSAPSLLREAGPAAPAPDEVRFTATHGLVLTVVLVALGVIVWGLTTQHWYLEEMGAVFIGLTVCAALVARLSPDRAAGAFAQGVSELTMTALLIGFARAIKVVLEDAQIIDTVVHAAATPLASLGPYASASGMVVIQSLINLFIPSGSGQAYVTMPLMAPIADLTGVTRQTAVLAYQFGDGFTNMLLPTSPVLMGILGIAGVSYERWLRFIFPLILKLTAAGIAAVLIAVAIGYR